MTKSLMVLLALALTACGKVGAPADPLDAAARRICINTIESRAVNRDWLAYIENDTPAVKNAKGQLHLSIKFSVNDEIGKASTMIARCIVSPEGKTLAAITLKDSR